MLLQVPTHLVQVMWMKWIEWNFFEFHPSTTIYNGAPHLITYDYNSWPKQWSINKDQNSNVFWTEIVKSIHFAFNGVYPTISSSFMILFKPAIKAKEPLPDEMSCLFWNVGHKYNELLCFGLFGNDHELCLFWALGHEHDELTACFGLLAMAVSLLVLGFRSWAWYDPLFWAFGNDQELVVLGSWQWPWADCLGFLGSWQLAMSSLFWTFGKLSTLGIKSVVCWFPVWTCLPL